MLKNILTVVFLDMNITTHLKKLKHTYVRRAKLPHIFALGVLLIDMTIRDLE